MDSPPPAIADSHLGPTTFTTLHSIHSGHFGHSTTLIHNHFPTLIVPGRCPYLFILPTPVPFVHYYTFMMYFTTFLPCSHGIRLNFWNHRSHRYRLPTLPTRCGYRYNPDVTSPATDHNPPFAPFRHFDATCRSTIFILPMIYTFTDHLRLLLYCPLRCDHLFFCSDTYISTPCLFYHLLRIYTLRCITVVPCRFWLFYHTTGDGDFTAFATIT